MSNDSLVPPNVTSKTGMVEFPATELIETQSRENEQALMDLSVTLAHRIRSLVASIEGFTDLLTDSLATSEQREMALRILEGAARIEQVLADLQLYSRPIEPIMMTVRIADVVAELLRFLDEAEMELFSVHLFGNGEKAIVADPTLFNQALLILLRNAFEATQFRTAIRLNVVCEVDGWAEFQIWNAGTIDVEDAGSRIFAPFFTTKAQNLGIGLPVARRIAEAHAGTLVLARNSIEAGTCFTLSVPMHQGPFASILDI